MSPSIRRPLHLVVLSPLLCLAMACSDDATTDTAERSAGDGAAATVVRRDPQIVGVEGSSVVLAADGEAEADLGGWVLIDADGNELRLPPSTKIHPGAELTVHPGPGTSEGDDLYLDTDQPFEFDSVVVLADAFGGEVDRFERAEDG